MKKLYEALSIITLFVFFYNFNWELYPTLILGAFAVAFAISNPFDEEKSSLSLEEYLLIFFALITAVTIYMHSNWIGMIAIGLYIVILIQQSTGDYDNNTGVTNKEFYSKGYKNGR